MLPVGGRQTAKFGSSQLLQRVEDPRLLKGAGRYTDDVMPAGTLHGVVVRSPHARARLLSVSAEAARAMPGVVAVYLAADLEKGGVGGIPCAVSLKNRDGTALRTPPRAGARRSAPRRRPRGLRCRRNGRGGARRGRGRGGGLRGAAQHHRPARGNGNRRPAGLGRSAGQRVLRLETGDKARADELFARAAHVTRLEIKNNRIVVASMEACAALAEHDRASGRWTLHTNTQGVWFVKGLLGHVFGVEPDQFRVQTDDVGGGFGMKIFLYAEQVLACYAARELGRPVKWTSSWSEAFLADTHGRDHLTVGELALDEGGGSSRCARASSPTWAPTSATTPPTSRRWPARRCSRACTISKRSTSASWACSRTPCPWTPTAAPGGRKATTWSSV